MLKMMRRSVSTLTASALVLGFLTFAPNTLASSTEFYTSPDTEFDYNQDSYIDFQVEMLGNSGVETPVVFKITGPLYENNEETQIIDTKWYDGNQTLTFSWNGRFNGEYVEDGEYRAVFEGADNTLTHKFYVTGDGNDDNNNNYDPEITFDPTPSSNYDPDDGDYEVSVRLTDAEYPAEVTVSVTDSDGDYGKVEEEYTYNSSTTHTFYLDLDQFDNADTLKLRVEGIDDDGYETNVLTRTIDVIDSNDNSSNDNEAWLSFNPKPSSTYDLDDGDYRFSVRLTDLDLNTRVYAYVKRENSSNYTEVDDFNFTQEGTHTFYWNGRLNGSTVSEGDYQLRVYGEDTNGDKTNVINHNFRVEDDNDNDSNDNSDCGDFEDVNDSDKNCDAIEWVERNGIMEGQGNGDFFDPNGVVNRAEMAKIATEAFDKFNSNVQYCDGRKPFPDVSANEWYSEYICRAKELDMITGYAAGPQAGNYVPNNDVTVLEMFAILLRPLDETMTNGPSYAGLASDQWYSRYANFAKDHNLYPGSSLNPLKDATRREVAQFLYELHLDGEL